MNHDNYGSYEDFDLAGVMHRMRWIKPGTFMMGSPENEARRWDDESLHQVTLTKGFWLAETACTQAAWTAVMGKNPSRFKGDDRPVERVSWNDCQDFLESANAVLPGGGLRLPTEAEWEYACRAGTTTRFSFGDEITTEQVNHGDESEFTVDVKMLPCNAWGLYQMHGNVCEWCQDWSGDYHPGPVEDPIDVERGIARERALRGGGWDEEPICCRSACRHSYAPGERHCFIGFRLARSAIGKQIS